MQINGILEGVVVQKIMNSKKIASILGVWDFKSYVFSFLYYRWVSSDGSVLSPEELLFSSDYLSSLKREMSKDELLAALDLENPRLGSTRKKREETVKRCFELVPSVSTFEEVGFTNTYEELLRDFSPTLAKVAGEFYTPDSLSDYLFSIAPESASTVYDPTCGSGSLLLKASNYYTWADLYGQDLSFDAVQACKMGLGMDRMCFKTSYIEHGDTLAEDKHKKKYDLILANPPFSTPWEQKRDARFSPAPLAPKSKADLAFVMHIASCMHEKSEAYCILFPGALYRGGAEKGIREYLVEERLVSRVIQMPEKMFLTTSISVVVLVLKRGSDAVTFTDASKCFKKIGKNNILSIEEAHKAPSRTVEREEIKKSDYTLSVSSYVSIEEPKEVIDIVALEAEIERVHAKNCDVHAKLDALVASLK